MRSSRLGLVLVVLTAATSSFAQVPAPAAEPAPRSDAPASAPVEPPVAPTPAPLAEPAPPPPEPAAPPAVEPATAPAVPVADSEPTALPLDAAGTVAAPPPSYVREAESPPWPRAHAPLTLEGRLGFLLRPDSGTGFDHESHVGAELGLSLYLELKRQLSLGIELERASLGGGTAISGLDSVSIDYTATSAMLGLRAYPKRSELLDVFVGVQIGAGIQGVSATGTASHGALSPARAFRCSGSDTPDFLIGGGVGARLMLTPRWGLSARLNATGHRLSGELIDDCAQGLGTATTISASFGLGYDFDLDP